MPGSRSQGIRYSLSLRYKGKEEKDTGEMKEIFNGK